MFFSKETACRLRPGRAAARFAVQHLHREQVAGFVHPDGHFEDVQLIRTPQELAAFRTRYGIPPETVIEKIY